MGREYFLDKNSMKELLESILSVAHEDVLKIQKAYQTACYKLTLRGGNIRKARGKYPPIILGRAVNREYLISFLEEHYGIAQTRPAPFFPFFRNSNAIKLFVQDLLLGTINDKAKPLLMSEFGTWITWRDDANENPFSWMVQNIADEVRAGLGLDGQAMGTILLLEYPFSSTKCLYRPTIADAGLFEYFEPPIKTHNYYGRTRPWPAAMATSRPTPVIKPPAAHPEALHEPISFAALALPVREVP